MYARNRYVCSYPIALLARTDLASFEQAMLELVMPQTRLLRRNLAGLSIDHRLLRFTGGRRTFRYMWEVALSDLQVVGAELPPEEHYDRVFRDLDVAVERAIEPWGTLGRRQVLLEVGIASV